MQSRPMLGVAAAGAGAAAVLVWWAQRRRRRRRVLVVGSINVDLFKDLEDSKVRLGQASVDMASVKGQTLPAKSFVQRPEIAAQLKNAGPCDDAEALLLGVAGPFVQKTGGKGANAAAAAGQTATCEFLGNLGSASEASNVQLLADLKTYGNVDTSRCQLLNGPTGTAYIFKYDDNDNAILLLGGANQSWADESELRRGGLRRAVAGAAAVMLQREIPDYVNRVVAQLARESGAVVCMDVGGSDAPLDAALLPYIDVVAPNESELTFISGVETKSAGVVHKALVRQAVGAMKAKFRAAGNQGVEVLVTLGEHGSMHFGRDWDGKGVENDRGLLPQECRMERFLLMTPDGKPSDTTGAGDCYRGSYVAARYADGMNVEAAMRWAAAAGSCAVEVQGAMPSMPSRSQIEARLAAGRQAPGRSSFDL